MKRRCLIALFTAALVAPAVATAQIPIPCLATAARGVMPATQAYTPLAAIGAPSVDVCVNGQYFSFTQFLTRGKEVLLPTQLVNLGNGASFTISATFNADPFAIFAFGSVLPGGFGPVSFDAWFTTPVVGGPYDAASSSGTLGVTATDASGGVTTGSASAGTYPAYISGWAPYPGTNLGVDIGSGVCSVGTPPSPNSLSCDPAPASNTFAPISPAFLTAYLSYTHTTVGAGASSVGWTGAVELTATAVPEPATLGLMLAGGVLLLVGVRRGARLR